MWEYENALAQLYQYSMQKTIAVPKRRQKWLCQDIDATMNRVYFDVMGINTGYVQDKEQRATYESDIAMRSADALMLLQKPLITLWDVQRYESKTMAKWANLIQRECALLRGIAKQKGSDELVI